MNAAQRTRALAGPAGWMQRGLAALERRLPALTRLKQPEPLPILLDRRRIYVLPSLPGLFFGALIVAMLVGALNYNNNPALLLCFVVASAFHTSLLSGYLSLRGVRLLQVQAGTAHAGDPLPLRFTFDAVEPRSRRGLVLRRDAQQANFSIGPGASAEVLLEVPTARRGWMAVGRLHLSTRHPLGLFRVWSWLHPERRVLVYPAAEPVAPPLPRDSGERERRARRGMGEQLHSLRDYRAGDPLRLVAWKRSAQSGHLLVREFETPAGGDVLLDWNALAGLDAEARIRRLVRWLLDAEREGLRTELRVPGSTHGPASGSDHLHACLRTLALLPGGEQ